MNNINEQTLYLASLIAGAVIKDEHWKLFGFKERPKRGKFFEKFVSKNELIKENFLIRELFLLSTIDVIEAIKNKDIAKEDKILYIIGVLSQLFLPLSQSKLFDDEVGFVKFLKDGINDYSNQAFISSLALRAGKELDENSAKSITGGGMIASVLSEKEKGIILDREIIVKEIFPVDPEQKLNIPLNKGKLEIYIKLAQEIIK